MLTFCYELLLDKGGQFQEQMVPIYYNFGLVYMGLKDYDKSRDYFHRYIELCKKKFGQNCIEVSRAHSILSELELSRGDTKASKELIE